MYKHQGVQNYVCQKSQNQNFWIRIKEVKLGLVINIFAPINPKFNEFYFGIVRINLKIVFHACTSGNFMLVHSLLPHYSGLDRNISMSREMYLFNSLKKNQNSEKRALKINFVRYLVV